MEILNGKQTSIMISEQLKTDILESIKSGKRNPRIDILLVGDDYASSMYVDMKSKRAKDLGIEVNIHRFEEDVEQQKLKGLIEDLNQDNSVDGIMVQLPLPKALNEDTLLETISPYKDVDGLTSTNLGKLFKNDPSAIAPATAKVVIELLREYGIVIEGKEAVVIGRGDISGLPIAAMLQNENATVVVCHSYTQNLKEICKGADILVASIGKPEYIDREYVKKGCVVVDIGTNRNTDGQLVGDVDFNSVKDIAGSLTPVPGGIGPMTIVCLFTNLIDIYKKNV